MSGYRPSSSFLSMASDPPTSLWTDIHVYGLVSWFWLNLDHYVSPGRGAPWLRGLPRIPQRGALLLHANSFYPSIHLSSLLPRPPPSISQCVLSLSILFFLPVKKTILSFSHVFPTHPPFITLPSFTIKNLFPLSSHISKSWITVNYLKKKIQLALFGNCPSKLELNSCSLSLCNLQQWQSAHVVLCIYRCSTLLHWYDNRWW